ncbi:RloB family protein [Methylomonas koyamae]|uniref:Uncharacterized protein n=1 Tax=Methylomonas koyamae TaxID=702114 RepID=A0A291IG87_9GAMM|nr:RloB family protein [Methylomonas koyamae]ATG89201.1 hypothetical protein MKLM6_0934 [Methylomonas koyamae]OAI24073.1 hypothetical protein A1356_16355 [Methylomonas koyamae]
MSRNAASFNRSKPRFKPQPTVLVICEDSKSGKRYLEDASAYFRVKVQVEICHCGKTDPVSIVNEAVARKGKFDRVFCAIDRDTHANFEKALDAAKSHPKVDVVVSYPCFEFWLLLHFGYSRKLHSPKSLIKDLRAYTEFADYDKSKERNIFQSLECRFPEARRLAPKVLTEAIDSGEMNPSTRLHELLAYFEELSQPQKIR